MAYQAGAADLRPKQQSDRQDFRHAARRHCQGKQYQPGRQLPAGKDLGERLA